MEVNFERAFEGSSDLSEVKKRRLAVLDSKLSGSQKKRRDMQRQQGAVEKIETLPHAQKRSEKSAKGRSSGTTKEPLTLRQEGGSSRESPVTSAPPYDVLSNDVNRGRLLTATKPVINLDGEMNYVDSLLEDVAATKLKMSSAKAPSGLRIQDKTLLLDNPAANVKKHVSQKHGRQIAMLSGVKLRNLGLHALRPEEIRYENLRSLNQRWERYARDAMRSASAPEEVALQLDMHGCLLAVKQHRNPQLVGNEGVVVKYSNSVFHIVSAKDRLHVVPRLKGSKFHIVLDQQCIVLHT